MYHRCRCTPCKANEAERARTYRETHKRQEAERKRVWHKTNRERVAESKRAWWETNRERMAERKRACYETNREQELERRRAYYRANRQAAFDRAAAYRARKLNATAGEVRRAEVWERDLGICYLCMGKADPDNWHLDHVIPLSRGGSHSLDNVAVTHPACNLRKGAKLPVEMGIDV